MTGGNVRGVTFVTKSLVPERGMERALLRLSARLADRDDVRIVVLDDSGRDVPGAVDVVALGARSSLDGLRRLRRHLLTHETDRAVVLVGLWISARALVSAPAVLPRAVAWEHSLTPGRIRSGPRFRAKAEAAGRAYRRCARVVTVSDVVADALQQTWDVEAVVVPNLLSLPTRSPGARRRDAAAGRPPLGDPDEGAPCEGGPSPARLIAVGAAKPVKNYDLMLRALARVRTPWTLRVLGGGPLQPSLEILAADLGLADRVQWLGDVRDVGPHLATSDLLIHPAASETFGYAMLEAAEQWCPVVALDAPVMNRLVPGSVPGVLCTPEEESLARAVESALGRVDGWDFAAADSVRRQRFSDDRTIATWREVLALRGEGDDG